MFPPLYPEVIMPRKARFNDIEKEERVAISVRFVEKDVWKQIRRLAAIRGMSMQDYFKYLASTDNNLLTEELHAQAGKKRA